MIQCAWQGKRPFPSFPPLLCTGYCVLCTICGFLLTACQPSWLEPPRYATATAQAMATPTLTPEPLVLELPDETAESINIPAETPVGQPNPAITVWVNETSPAHKIALEQMTAEFRTQYGIDVEMVLVEPSLLPKLVDTAVLTYTLPDVILHPLEYTVGWAEQGILDAAAAEVALTQLGRDTFDTAALNLVQLEGQTVALPSDGYQQLIIYRIDWFEQQNLAIPDNFSTMLAAAQTISNTASFINGFVVPTESNLITAHQIFEQIALANGCHLIDDKGEVTLLNPACQEALDFYYAIIHNYSPTGVQTDTSTRNAYLFGRTGLIMAPPSLLPLLAGLDSAVLPSCTECLEQPGYLAENSGILTQLTGSGPTAVAANYGEIIYLGITSQANREAAIAFARYWFTEGYTTWLAVETEMKVPMRLGTAESPRQFIDSWGTLPVAGSGQSLQDIYGEEVVTHLRDGIATSPRWGLREGQGELVANVYQKLLFSVVLQEMLSGYFDTTKTLQEAYRRVTDLIPNYEYTIELLEPTATPDQ